MKPGCQFRGLASDLSSVRFIGPYIKEPRLCRCWIADSARSHGGRAPRGSAKDSPSLGPGITTLGSFPGALRYLHGLVPSVAHGDLKPSNILVLDRSSSASMGRLQGTLTRSPSWGDILGCRCLIGQVPLGSFSTCTVRNFQGTSSDCDHANPWDTSHRCLQRGSSVHATFRRCMPP